MTIYVLEIMLYKYCDRHTSNVAICVTLRIYVFAIMLYKFGVRFVISQLAYSLLILDQK